MTLHRLLPLVAFLLNLSLAGISIARNPGARLNRLFTYFVSAMALWNFGVFMLRQAPDASAAAFWEKVIHVGIIGVPVFYYHFVLIFLEETARHRRSLMGAYGLAIAFSVLNLGGAHAFLKGVTWTAWGWAPATGLLYAPFFLYVQVLMITGISKLAGVYREADSSFRRSRAALILLGTVVSVVGGLIDFGRFIVSRFVPVADLAYPIGIPANMIFAVMLGTSIVRYRMFDVSVVVKRIATYLLIGATVTGAIAAVTRAIEVAFDLEGVSAVWAILPMGLIVALLISPIGQAANDRVQRLMLSRRRGCYDTLLDLSKRMSLILHFDRLVDTLVAGLVRGIPVTHCVLLIQEPGADVFVTAGVGTSTGENPTVAPIRTDSPIVAWLKQTGRVLVKEEAKLNPEIAVCFETVEDDLEQVRASLIVPLKIENTLIGILLLGEKLSGEIFDNQELDVLSLLSRQAAISLENARLYQELSASNAQLREASRLKSQFLASMSHELRTPLNSIIGFSKVLLNRLAGELTEAQETYLRSVHSSSTHLLQLINEILAFSRIEAGREEIVPEDVELHTLIDECIDSSVALARGKPVKVEKNVPLELPRIRADRLKVKQVLLNLLSNAVKFTASGRVVVRVQPGPEAVHVSVADTGIGIREQDLARLFQPFQQLDSQLARDANRKAGGTGLGLAISKKFVELHGGSIWAESREGQGSAFHFTLPLHEEIAGT